MYEQKSPPLQQMHTQGLSLALAACVKAWLHFCARLWMFRALFVTFLYSATDQTFPLLSDRVCNSWTPYMLFWSFKEFVLWELLETLFFYHLKDILSLLSLLTLKIQLKNLGLVRFYILIFIFLKEINTQQGCIKCMKSDSKDIYKNSK